MKSKQKKNKMKIQNYKTKLIIGNKKITTAKKKDIVRKSILNQKERKYTLSSSIDR